MTSFVKKVKTKKNKIIEEVIPKYKLISSHTGRRTFITLSLNDNIRPDIVMKTTGHKKFETMKRYTKITDKNVSKEYTEKKKIKPDGDTDKI
jgi:integrase